MTVVEPEPTAGDRERRRHQERHAAASIRALSGRTGVELRGSSLRVDDRRVAIATPFLVADIGGVSAGRSRGIADGLGLLLKHCDLALHDRLRPDDLFERIVFDLLEQLRCESLAPPELVGVRENVNRAFDAWCESARAERVDESHSAMLVYTVTQMARSRLTGRSLPEHVDDLIETTRGHLGPVIGHAIRRLREMCHDQTMYAEPAREIARLVAEVAADSSTTTSAADDAAKRFRLVVPADWVDDNAVPVDGDTAGTAADAEPFSGRAGRESLGDQHVFTRRYDRVVAGRSLYPASRLARLRSELDGFVAAQAVSPIRLAQRLLALFGAPTHDDWEFGVDHGSLDGRRLSQLVANPDDHEVFRRRRDQLRSQTAVTFLIDNSGSMKRLKFEAVAVLVDTLSRALDLAGITNEVLGFTTGAWSGGRAATDWRRAGSPDEPGRLNELLHIVYKDADESWRRARPSLAAMATPLHYREGVDGEAIAWAHRRLAARRESRKVLIVVSDGAPNDSATSNTNRAGFLDDHLSAVVAQIEAVERSGHPDAVQLGAIGIDLAVGDVYRRWVDLDLTGTLALHHYRALETLFARRHPSASVASA